MAVDLATLPENIPAAALKLAERIDFESAILKGGNGVVLTGRNRILNRKVVAKFYYWGDGAHMEPRLLETLASPHVLKVDDAAAIDEDYAYFIAPFCEDGDLDDVLAGDPIGLKSAIDKIIDVATGANAIHAAGYIHRDLKPSNIFCTDKGRLVIGDFGSVVAKGMDGYAQTATKHSLLYRTPEEILTGKAYPQGDVYQIGIVLYQMLGGRLHYNERDWLTSKEAMVYDGLSFPENQFYATRIIEQKIIKGKLLDYSSLPAWCPPELAAIIKKCCKVSLTARIDNSSTLIAKLHNIRSTLPDWRFEPEPVLYKSNCKIRLVQNGEKFTLEKMGKTGSAWRKDRKIKPCSAAEAVAAALA